MARPNDVRDENPPANTLQSMAIAPVSASDLLDDPVPASISSARLRTSVRSIDRLLDGGFERGKVTEIWGAPGTGRDAIALTASLELLKEQRHVTWLACAHPLSSQRLSKLPQHAHCLHQIYPPTLSHLVAILKFPASFMPESGQDLLVVDDLSALVDLEYSRQSTFTSSADSETRKWRATRRSAILANIVTYLNQLATAHNLAVLVVNGCATTSRSRSGQSAILVSAVGGLEWEAGIWCRLALLRDFSGRFAALQRSRGSNVPATSFHDHLAHFAVSADGLAVSAAQAQAPSDDAKPAVVVVRSNKRKIEEIADSDGELDEYGWNAEEELEVQIIE